MVGIFRGWVFCHEVLFKVLSSLHLELLYSFHTACTGLLMVDRFQETIYWAHSVKYTYPSVGEARNKGRCNHDYI